MKKYFVHIVSLLQILYYRAKYRIDFNRCLFYRSSIYLANPNNVSLHGGSFVASWIRISGKNNTIKASNCQCSHSSILINGNGNSINIEDGTDFGSLRIVLIGNHCHIHIGRSTKSNGTYLCCTGGSNYIEIGRDCLFANDTEIWASDTHEILSNKTGGVINTPRPVKIGEHVWMGRHSRILKGTTVGANAVIGLSTVVTKDILPNTVNVGIPSHIIKQDINWRK